MAKHAAQLGAPTTHQYVASLDGLRAFAVLAVIAYHMNRSWAPGGLMGVTVFFVISGYLINGLLVAERERTGHISLKGFWLRRVRRILPAVLLSIAGIAALCTVFNPDLLDKMQPDIVPSLFFFNNWWQIFHDVSYFEAAGAPSPLMHFWSLSIEEQFYIVWPLLLVLMYRLGLKKKPIAAIILVLAVLSALEMALLYDPHGDPSRIYYGTDTRAMSLLLGCWLAFVLPSDAFGKAIQASSLHPVARFGVNLLGVASFAGLLAIVLMTNGFSAFPYLGGIAAVSVLSAMLIGVLVIPGSWMARIFQFPLFVYIGKRSYSMYLWHLPIILLTTNVNAASSQPWWMHLVQLALIIAASELSYRFIENPIRRNGLKGWLASCRVKRDSREKISPLALTGIVVPTLCFVALVGVGSWGLYNAQPGANATAIQEAVQHEPVQRPERPAPEEAGETDITTYQGMFLTPRTNATTGQPIYEPLLIGDSVSLGAEEEFYEVFPYGFLDSVVSRNIWESPYDEYLADGNVGEFVVFCLGTNNAVEDFQIDELLNPISSDKHVILVNTRSSTDWFEDTNAVINRTPLRYPNVTVIDWYSASEGHDEYFAGDGTHLTDEGARAYVAQIGFTIKGIYDKTNDARIAAKERADEIADAKWNVGSFVEQFFV